MFSTGAELAMVSSAAPPVQMDCVVYFIAKILTAFTTCEPVSGSNKCTSVDRFLNASEAVKWTCNYCLILIRKNLFYLLSISIQVPLTYCFDVLMETNSHRKTIEQVLIRQMLVKVIIVFI